MKETEHDNFDKLFRDKLFDWEAEPGGDDWAGIADRLPQGKVVPFWRPWKYVAAAAVVSFGIVTGTLFLHKENVTDPSLALKSYEIKEFNMLADRTGAENGEIQIADSLVLSSVNRKSLQDAGQKRGMELVSLLEFPEIMENSDEFITAIPEVELATRPEEKPAKVLSTRTQQAALPANAQARVSTRSSENTPFIKDPVKKAAKRWGVGMGGGSLAAGTTNSVGSFLDPGVRSLYTLENGLALMNMAAASNTAPKIDREDHVPVSFGLSVSRRLNDRFSLQSGLVYTYLSSEWKTDGTYTGEFKQRLHYLGIPLSVVYKIAEWDKFVFYASAGGMGEVNVSGKMNAKMFSPTHTKVQESTDHIRMKEMLWSMNANVGVSYPLIRFVNLFAETGASYYFDNNSDIETIRSERPFNVNFQLGFRFGF